MDAIKHFTAVVPGFMAKLLRDFPELDVLDAAAIFGNAGHESGGLVTLQEIKPTVAGSRGGWGWMQWTGPRRRAFEAYAKRNGLGLSSDKANYKFLFLELKGLEGTEKAAIAKLISAGPNLEAKVKAFELAFLRAGVKHYPSRLVWAERALAAWNASAKMLEPDPIDGGIAPPDMPRPKPAPVQPGKAVETKKGFGVGAVVVVLVIIAIAVAVWFIGFRR